MLLTLEEISQLVSHSHHPGETLSNIVRLIHGRFHTDVCSVYLLEPDRAELVLGATVGLRQESVGQVRMRLDEGLTGLVAQQMTPVMVDEAPRHPRFKFFREAGEEPYHSFLGVPLIESGAIEGVLVVQTREPRLFSPNEVRTLVAVAAQLAPLVSEAQLLGQVAAAAHDLPFAGTLNDGTDVSPVLHGTPLSPGAGAGAAYLVDRFVDWGPPSPGRADPETEQERLARALAAAQDEIARLGQQISELVGEEHGAILQGQLMILQDATIAADLAACLQAGSPAEDALLQTLHKYVEAFQKLTNPYFQERVYDIKDVFRRLLWHLRPRTADEFVGDRLVLVAHEASVMDLFSVDLDRLAAVVVEHGGAQSHAAILARSLRIPMVGQAADVLSRVRPGQPLSVDGTTGVVRLDAGAVAGPSTAEVARRPEPAPTAPVDWSGLPRLEVNVNLLCEVDQAVAEQAAGVGLYRSEFLFLARRTLPTEEEQVRIYRKLLARLGGRPVSIRTFDLRPDKIPQSSQLSFAAAHLLDWRLVLESPPLQKLFKDQVRAILRAAVGGPVRILVPLVTRSELLDFVGTTVAAARAELDREGLEHVPEVPLGVMIEVAAAAGMINAWAGQVDYFALGTNDLLASSLGLDRDHASPAELDPMHPGFLRVLRQIVKRAKRAGRPVTVCGEMAGTPEGSLALASLGVDALSVAVPQLAAVRRCLAALAGKTLPDLGVVLKGCRTSGEVRSLLQAVPA